MPHFDKDGNETVICQSCSKIIKGLDATWMKPVPGKSFNGNVCKECLSGIGTGKKSDPVRQAIDRINKNHSKLKEMNPKVGDVVHLGLAVKGGAGFIGKITKIEGDVVYISKGEKTWKGPIRNITLRESILSKIGTFLNESRNGKNYWK